MDNQTTSELADSRLRLVLRVNATTSALSGALAAIAPRSVDELLGTGQVGWVRLVGVGLVAFAALVVVASRLATEEMVRAVPGISLGDAAWVVGTAGAIGLGWFSTAGAIAMGAVGLIVGVFAAEQTLLVRSLRPSMGAA